MSYNPESERDADLNGMGLAMPGADETEEIVTTSSAEEPEQDETIQSGMMPPHLLAELKKGRTSRQTSELIQQIERAVTNGEPLSGVNAMPPIQENLLAQIDQAYNGTEGNPGLRNDLIARDEHESKENVKGGIAILGSLLGWNKSQIEQNPQAVMDEASKAMGVVEKWVTGPFAALVKKVQSWAGGTQTEVENAGATLAKSGTTFRGAADMETVQTVGHGVMVGGQARGTQTEIT
ncbi:MAG: hypothetical protein MRY32_00685 [Rickettsiales bacterium]|nr:hypothetical protein [Rickettsiales bacterium]